MTSAGCVEGNSPFQAVWLPDEVRDTYLKKSARAGGPRRNRSLPRAPSFSRATPPPTSAKTPCCARCSRRTSPPPPPPRIWLGAPNSIKGPTEAVFHRQSGTTSADRRTARRGGAGHLLRLPHRPGRPIQPAAARAAHLWTVPRRTRRNGHCSNTRSLHSPPDIPGTQPGSRRGHERTGGGTEDTAGPGKRPRRATGLPVHPRAAEIQPPALRGRF